MTAKCKSILNASIRPLACFAAAHRVLQQSSCDQTGHCHHSATMEYAFGIGREPRRDERARKRNGEAHQAHLAHRVRCLPGHAPYLARRSATVKPNCAHACGLAKRTLATRPRAQSRLLGTKFP